MYKFTNSVKLFLHKYAITQSELANYLGVKKQYLSSYLNNDFDSITLELNITKFMLNYQS